MGAGDKVAGGMGSGLGHHPLRLPGLLPWQVCLLAACCGILCLVHPLPALVALVLLWLAAWRLMGWFMEGGPPAWVWALALAACFGLGLGYAALRLPDPAPDPVLGTPQWMLQRDKVEVTGRVEEVVGRYGDRLRVILSQVAVRTPDGAEHMLPGKLTWTWEEPETDSSQRPGVGRMVRFTSRIYPVRWFGNPGQESIDFYFHSRGVYWRTYLRGPQGVEEWGPPGLLDRLLHDPRDGLLERTASLVPDTTGGGMVLALLFGERDQVDTDDYQVLMRAGLAHTLALSGLHVGFVVFLGMVLARLVGGFFPGLYLRIPRPRLAVLLSAPLVLAYVWLGQAGPSLTRAACMFGFWGLLLLLGRNRVALDGLFWALALILAVSPLALYDLRLQLSFAAVAGIVVFMPWLLVLFRGGLRFTVDAGMPRLRIVWWAAGMLAVSLAANLAALPLSSWYFGQYAPNLLPNLVWLPLLGLVVMPLAMAGLVLVPLWAAPASWLLGASAWVLDRMLDGLIWLQGLGLAPLISLLRPLWPAWLGFGLLAAVLVVALNGHAGTRRRPDWLLALLAGGLLLAGPVLGMARDGRDHVSLDIIDVGAGQALLVTAPGGSRWLVDGGGSHSPSFDVGRSLVAPWLAMGHAPLLDGVVLTHPHLDHYEGLCWVLNHFRVRAFAFNGLLPSSSYREPLLAGLADNGLTPRVLRAGEALELGPDLVLEVVHPADPKGLSTNDGSLVLRLAWRGRGLALLAADVEAAGLAQLMDRAKEQGLDLSADLLILPHHGSDTSPSPELYAAVSPRLAVASTAWRDQHDHPGPLVREGLVEAGVPWTDTARAGLVRAAWPGPDAAMRIQAFRPGGLPPGFVPGRAP